MMFLCLIPTLLSTLVLAAHFLRSGPAVFALLSLAVPLLLLISRRWALRSVQILLLLGAAEWVRTLITLVGEREAKGESWQRLVIILGSVAAFTAVSALILQIRKVRNRYRDDPEIDTTKA